MNKPDLIAKILVELNAELEGALREAREAAEAATDPDSLAENKYDTRALESSYLARGQARRAEELAEAVSAFKQLEENPPGASTVVGVGSLVTLATPTGPVVYFLGPSAGGTEVRLDGKDVILITAASPLGRQLVGKSAGATVSLRPGSPAWTVKSVE